MSHQGTFSFKDVDMEAGDVVSLKLRSSNKRDPATTIEGAVIGMNEEGHLLFFNPVTYPFVTNGRFFIPPERVVTIQVTCPAKEAVPHHTSKQFAYGDQTVFRVGEEIVHQGRLIAAFEDRILVQKEDGTIIDGWAINFSSIPYQEKSMSQNTALSGLDLARAANANHPELKDGEMFLGNYTEDDFHEYVGYQTKRLGQTAYDVNGKVVERLFPVFVWKSEYNDRTQAL